MMAYMLDRTKSDPSTYAASNTSTKTNVPASSNERQCDLEWGLDR